MRQWPAIALLASIAGTVHAEQPAKPLRVLLQGNSAPELAALVERHGGKVTHHLPIINAVGATISRAQLDVALTSPLIKRHLDDLSVSDDPEEPAPPEGRDCPVRGALELDRTEHTVSWRWYSNKSTAAKLSGLNLSWPPHLGRLTALTLDGKTLAPVTQLQQPGKVRLKLGEKEQPEVAQLSTLALTFPADAPSRPGIIPQRLFSLEAQFGDECSIQLIPGYDDNNRDSYYPTVVGADQLHRNGVTGRGVTVAILDSGLWEHPNLALDTRGNERIVARYDAILDTEPVQVLDESGHGTHLASAMASSAPVEAAGELGRSFKGIAPDAQLIPVKAFNTRGQGDFLDIVRGIQWVVEHRDTYNISVLNLSFAAAPRWPYWEDPINQALMKAWQAGITVVAAAGNEGPDPMSVGSPGNLPYIITVGATTDSWTVDDRADDYIPDFSSRGPTPSAHIKPDLVAPGGHISGITRPGSTLTQRHPEYMLSNGELTMTGTSQAAAIVSGIIALLQQIEPQLSPDDVKCKLTSSAEPAINANGLLSYSPFEQGEGYVSATRAVTLGQTGCANRDLNLAQDIQGIEHYQGPAIVDDAGNISLPGLSKMVDPQAPAKGASDDRRWGVKAHIEERVESADRQAANISPFNWEQRYYEEKTLIKRLANPPASR